MVTFKHSIPVVGSWRATDRKRYRVNWRRRIVLQVQEERRKGTVSYGIDAEWHGVEHRWRDATADDLINCPP